MNCLINKYKTSNNNNKRKKNPDLRLMSRSTCQPIDY